MVPHSKPLLGKAEEEAAVRVVRSGILAQGPECEAFEAELAEYLGTEHVVAVSSGSAALHLSLLALGIRQGHQVGLPSYVCTALLNAVRHTGASPVLIDLPEQGHNLSPDDAPTHPDCTILPHMFGHAAPVDRFPGQIVEDCAMAIGGTHAGRKLGSIGKLGVFSFYATKVLCSGEGGAVCTNDQGLAASIRDLRDYDGRDVDTSRYNYKMTDIQAAIGRVQLESLDRFVSTRRELRERYDQALAGCDTILPCFRDGELPFRYVVRTPNREADDVIRTFEAEGVAARKPVFRPLHDVVGTNTPFPNTDRAFADSVSIPLYPALTEADITQVLEAAKKTL